MKKIYKKILKLKLTFLVSRLFATMRSSKTILGVFGFLVIFMVAVKAIVDPLGEDLVEPSKFPFVGRVGEFNVPGSPLEWIGCTGFLIHPRIMVTSATCVVLNDIFLEGFSSATFDPVAIDLPEPPRPVGGSPASPYKLNGTVVLHPEFYNGVNPFCIFNAGGSGDYTCIGDGNHQLISTALFVLDEPVYDIAPVPVAPLDFWNGPGHINTEVTSVGYGALGDHDNGLVGENIELTKGIRRWTKQTVDNVHAGGRTLQINANIARGNGGTCSGDAGAPYLLDDPDTAELNPVAAALVFAGDFLCNNLDLAVRLDNPEHHCFFQIVKDAVDNNQPLPQSCFIDWVQGHLPTCSLYQEIATCMANL